VRTDRVDAELANIETHPGETLANLALIQRDDGQLTDGLVEYYNLSAPARRRSRHEVDPRGLWATATAYVVNDMVDVAGSSYICAIAHTSGTFATDYAAGKWQIFVPRPLPAASPSPPQPPSLPHRASGHRGSRHQAARGIAACAVGTLRSPVDGRFSCFHRLPKNPAVAFANADATAFKTLMTAGASRLAPGQPDRREHGHGEPT
jgi:hypothetical protein